ncbi:hypothetical protein Tco_0494270 [Tanacetum coccineum]
MPGTVSSDPGPQWEKSSRHVDRQVCILSINHPSAQRWTRDNPLEQVIGTPSQSVQTRRQLETNGEMCMFALTVSRTKPKNIKEAMSDSAWIESMQELHQFDRLDVEKGIVELFFVGTEYQLADLFTKALSEDRFKYLVRRLGMRCLTLDELEVLAIESA